jgi:hypothetical protein
MRIVAVDRTRGYIGLRVGCSKLNIFGRGAGFAQELRVDGDAVVGFQFSRGPASRTRSVMFLNSERLALLN